MKFQKGNQTGPRFQPGQSGNPGGRTVLQREFERLFYKALLNDKLRQKAMRAFQRAIDAGEGWAIKFYFEKALPAEPIRLEIAPDISRVQAVILEALAQYPEARIAVAQRLLEVGKAIDTPYESVQ